MIATKSNKERKQEKSESVRRHSTTEAARMETRFIYILSINQIKMRNYNDTVDSFSTRRGQIAAKNNTTFLFFCCSQWNILSLAHWFGSQAPSSVFVSLLTIISWCYVFIKIISSITHHHKHRSYLSVTLSLPEWDQVEVKHPMFLESICRWNHFSSSKVKLHRHRGKNNNNCKIIFSSNPKKPNMMKV